VRFLKKFKSLNYLTDVESFTVSVAFVVALSVAHSVALGVAFSVADFSPQDVIREIVVKSVKEIKNNFFIFKREIKVYLLIYIIKFKKVKKKPEITAMIENLWKDYCFPSYPLSFGKYFSVTVF
jgi:hypothetical protein